MYDKLHILTLAMSACNGHDRSYCILFPILIHLLWPLRLVSSLSTPCSLLSHFFLCIFFSVAKFVYTLLIFLFRNVYEWLKFMMQKSLFIVTMSFNYISVKVQQYTKINISQTSCSKYLYLLDKVLIVVMLVDLIAIKLWSLFIFLLLYFKMIYNIFMFYLFKLSFFLTTTSSNYLYGHI